MLANYTDITIILDKSGSMRETWTATITGYNKYLEELSDSNNSVIITHYQFNDSLSCVYSKVPLKNAPKLNIITYAPSGYTALLDAIGDVIVMTGDRLKELAEEARPNKVLIVIITDGQENSSHLYRKSKISEMILHQQEKYNWDFVFIGANQDSFTEAGDLSIAKGYTINYEATMDSTSDMWSKLSHSSVVYCTRVRDSLLDHSGQLLQVSDNFWQE